VTRHEFLRRIHEAYQPRSYLEIGVSTGASLGLSRARTIAIDPAFKITSEIRCDVQVVKATSDDFFARADGLTHFPDELIDLAFVDGLHLFEFALRDFINVERHADWTSVIVVDDVLPRNVAEASRERGTMVAWTGDVFKIVEVLARHRPDLLLVALDTDPTGVLLVLGADPESRVLAERYDEIVAEHVYPDPQRVPEKVLRREKAIAAASLAHAGIWADLRDARDSGMSRRGGWDRVRRSLEAAARPAALRELTPAQLQPRKSPRPRPPRRLAGVRRRLRPVRRRLRKLRAPRG
jgi:methyltransferase family protein